MLTDSKQNQKTFIIFNLKFNRFVMVHNGPEEILMLMLAYCLKEIIEKSLSNYKDECLKLRIAAFHW